MKDAQIVAADYRPSDDERAELGQVLSLPGFEVIEKIALSVVASTKQILMRVNPLDNDYSKTVVEMHRRAQICEGLWEEIRQKIEQERTILKQPRESMTLPDVTETAFEDVERQFGIR